MRDARGPQREGEVGEMPVRQGKNAEASQKKEQMGRSRLSLIIQQVEKEAQQRMNELEAKMENALATIDKAYKVELMKMPLSLQNTRMVDLISEEISSSEVSIALKNESLPTPQALRRAPSKRGKSTATADNSTPPQRSSAKTSKAVKAAKMQRTLAGSNSTGNLRSSSLATKRSQSRTVKTAEHAKPRLRSVASTGDLHCSMAASAAHVTVTTAQGQTLSFSEETKHDINLDLLDDVAWCQIHKLTSLMEYLSRKSRSQR